MNVGGNHYRTIWLKDSPATNYGFDVTSPEFATGLITERGVCEAKEKSVLEMFPENKRG